MHLVDQRTSFFALLFALDLREGLSKYLCQGKLSLRSGVDFFILYILIEMMKQGVYSNLGYDASHCYLSITSS